MSAAVRIGAQGGDGSLGFDLREVVAAVGPQDHLRWTITEADLVGEVAGVWPDGARDLSTRSEQGRGVSTDWATLTRLAQVVHQTIDGRFVGYGEAGNAELMLLARDSSYWIVWATDPTVLAAIRRSFVGVVESDEPGPLGV